MNSEQELPVIGGFYRHFKGGLYVPVGFAEHTESKDDLVIYHSVIKPYWLWARPLSMWNESVEVDGKTVPRFEYLPASDETTEALWDAMKEAKFESDITGERLLAEPFYIFDEETFLDDILEYFDNLHSKGVHYLLYERNSK